MKENEPGLPVSRSSTTRQKKETSPAGSAPQRYYTVTQVCRRLKIEPHVLRYWERQFDISFKRSSAGRRVISPRQLEKLEFIHYLLHTEGLTVRGVRHRLARMRSAPPDSATPDAQQNLFTLLQRELIALRTLLQSGSPAPSEHPADARTD